MTLLGDGSDVVTAAPLTTPLLREVPAPAARHRRRSWSLLHWGVSPFLATADAAAAAVAGLTAVLGLTEIAVFTAVVIVSNAVAGLHRSRLTLSVLDDSMPLIGRGLAAATMALAADIVIGRSASAKLLVAAAVYGVAVVLLRAAAYIVVRSVRRTRYITHRTLVIGAGEVGRRIVSVLREHPEYGLQPVGFLDSDPLLAPAEREVPLLGGYNDLSHVIRNHEISEAILAFGSAPESGMVDILRTCDRLECEIFLVPRLFEMHSGSGQGTDHVWGLPLVRMRRAAFRSPSWRLKRVFDVVVSAFALVLTSPLMGMLALAVRLEGGSGVLFRQTRVGIDGRPFQLLKFRSLRPADDQESATKWSLLHDARVGPVGKLLRRTSLDELPQLWNVLVGDMSLVGPRPERPYFVERFEAMLPRYTHRHRVPAGLTGWAQVHGLRGDTSIEDRAQFDNYYIENWSLWLDIKILLRTTLALVHRTG